MNSINTLPEPYNRLAMLRCPDPLTEDLKNTKLLGAFVFDDTPEGHDWWWGVAGGNYLKIPEMSMRELNNEFVTPNIK